MITKMRLLRWGWILTATWCVLFLIRVLLFANEFGSLSHDGGWISGVSRGIAEYGKYVTYTNTSIADEPGAVGSIHGRSVVQDQEGLTYFSAGVTVGPGFTFPSAIFVKMFGPGYWGFRAWPIIGFIGLVFVLSQLSYFLGGGLGNILMMGWFWLIPRMYMQTAYEAYGETVAIALVLASGFVLFDREGRPRNSFRRNFAAGVVLAFAILTKLLMSLSTGIFVFAFALEMLRRKRVLAVLKPAAGFAAGVTTPALLYEAYRYLYLLNKFGHKAWQMNNEDYRLTFISGGSGFGVHNAWEKILAKLTLFQVIGPTNWMVVWPVALLLPVPFFLLRETRKRLPALYLWCGVMGYGIWFIFFSVSLFSRHVMQIMLCFMLLLSCALASVLSEVIRGPVTRRAIALAGSVVLGWGALVGTSNAQYFDAPMKFSWDYLMTNWYQGAPHWDGMQRFPPFEMIPLPDQKEVVEFIDKHLPEDAQLFYLEGLLVAELPPLVGKVFYPYWRIKRLHDTSHPHYVIFGGFQRPQWPWTVVDPDYIQRETMKFCARTVFDNPTYLICEAKEGV